jgi:phage terminase Nu1 subunit (DNA packaging protein)
MILEERIALLMSLEQTIDTRDAARLLLLTPHRIRQLVCEGVLHRAVDKDGKPLRGRFDLLELVNSYIRYQRNLILGGSLKNGDEYSVARTRKMNASASIEELRLKRIHGRLHYAEDIEFVWTSQITSCKQRLLAIPSRCARPLVGKTDISEIAELLRVEIYGALAELAEYDPVRFEQANEEYLASVGAARPETQADTGKNGGNGQDGAEP